MTAIADKPWFDAFQMHCNACRAGYTGFVICGCSMAMAAAYIATMTCPQCGSGAAHQTFATEQDSNADP